MALSSKCPKCDKSSFELADAKIDKCRTGQYFVQCAACGAVVGTIPHIDPTAAHGDLAKRLDKIEKAIADLPR